MPIVIYSLSGTCGLPCLKDIADDLKDEIEGVTGVLEVEVTGGLEREIRIEVFTEKLAYYGLSIGSLQNAVRSENTNTSGGNIVYVCRLRRGLSVPTPIEVGQPIPITTIFRSAFFVRHPAIT